MSLSFVQGEGKNYCFPISNRRDLEMGAKTKTMKRSTNSLESERHARFIVVRVVTIAVIAHHLEAPRAIVGVVILEESHTDPVHARLRVGRDSDVVVAH